MTQSLQALLDRAGRDDHEAFATFYDLTVVDAWRLAAAASPHRVHAEDVVARAYEQAWSHAGRCGPSGLSPRVWLLSLVQSAARAQPREGHPDAQRPADAPP